MVLVGIIEGSCYVFGFYLIYEDKDLKSEYRELSINICFVFNDSCCLLSSLFCLLLDNTLLYVKE